MFDIVKRFFNLKSNDTATRRLFSAVGTRSGVSVNYENALQCATVYACIRVLSESVAGLPLILYRREDAGKVRASTHPLYDLMHGAPNPEQTPFEFFDLMQGWLGSHGNAFAKVARAGNRRPVALWPIHPDSVSVRRQNGMIVYSVEAGRGVEEISEVDMLHVRAFSSDGILGLSPIAQARESIGLSLAAQQLAGDLFANDATPRGVMEIPGSIGTKIEDRKEMREEIRKAWEESQGGSRRGSIAILDQGGTYKPVSLPLVDAQFIENRKFQVTEIARWFRVPPHMVGDLEKATFSNIEQQSIDFVTHTVRPWLVRWEQSLNRALLTAAERREYYFEFLTEALLRGTIKDRFDAYAVARQGGWMNVNEIRARENLNDIGDKGNVYLSPTNMITAEQAEQWTPGAGTGQSNV